VEGVEVSDVLSEQPAFAGQSTSVYTVEERCRSCGADGLHDILPLGATPLANALLKPDDLTRPETKIPLTLCVCGSCALVQLRETVDPEVMFSDYVYFSSFSDTMLKHSKEIVDRTVGRENLGQSSLVVEIASNDGYLLQYYKQQGIPVLGIEPAANIAEVATKERGIPTRVAFFSADVASALRAEGVRASVIHGNNVFAHVPDTNGFMRGIATLLDETGVAIIEAPYVKTMLDNREFDTIYHEHVFYFSLTAVDRLARRHGLVVADVEELSIHGGSLRFYLRHASASTPSSRVRELLEREQAWGVDDRTTYDAFADEVKALRQSLRSLLTDLKAGGSSLVAYGASAKGSTLLNYFGIGRELIDFVVDRSTVKQGRFTPGTHLLIRPVDALAGERPDYVLLLTWNFKDEILGQQASYRRAGGKFIIPVPEPVVV
jgi:SAM-dependent methyltransferase